MSGLRSQVALRLCVRDTLFWSWACSWQPAVGRGCPGTGTRYMGVREHAVLEDKEHAHERLIRHRKSTAMVAVPKWYE